MNVLINANCTKKWERRRLIENGSRQIENFLTSDERTEFYMHVLEKAARQLRGN